MAHNNQINSTSASCLLFCGAKKQPSRSGELFGRYVGVSTSVQNLYKFCLALLGISMLTSCCALIPHKAETYEGDFPNYSWFENPIAPKKLKQLAPYTVGDSYISASIHHSVGFITDGKAPYSMFVKVWDTKSPTDLIKIHSLTIKSGGKVISGYVLSGPNSESSVDTTPENFPISFNGENGLYFYTNDLDIEFDKSSTIEMRLDIEIFNSEGANRGIVQYIFRPIVSWDPLVCLSV